jgi:hypothetical protein
LQLLFPSSWLLLQHICFCSGCLLHLLSFLLLLLLLL